MLFNSQQRRFFPQNISLTKSLSINQNQTSNPRTSIQIKRRIETQQSISNHMLKSSIISEQGINSQIFQWRKTVVSPIVKVIQLAKRSQIDIKTGLSWIYKTIKPEPILCKLNSFHNFSKEQLLLILKSMLDGHQTIFKKMKGTSVSLDKCVVTIQGKVKVWVNQYFERNDISGVILSKQDDITKNIYEIFNVLTAIHNQQQKLNEFFEYVNSYMKKSGKWSFSSLRALLKSYTDCLRIKIPQKINIKNLKKDKRQIQSSLIQNKPKSFLPRSHHNSFSSQNRNIKSSLNYSGRNLVCSNQFLFDKVVESRSRSPAQKEIYHKTTCSTIPSLASKTKHNSSISHLKENQDGIIQKTKASCHSKNDFLKIISNVHEHRKYPSINDILLTKIGFCPLPQVNYEEQCSSPSSAQKTNRINQLEHPENENHNNFSIFAQYNLLIQKPQNIKPTKESSISTTNQTLISGKQNYFSKKIKESHLTINLAQNKENIPKEEFRTASRDRFKQKNIGLMTEQPKKALGSCTIRTNNQNTFKSFDLSSLLRQVRDSNVQNKQVVYPKQKLKVPDFQISNQIIQFNNIDQKENQLKKQITPIKTPKNLVKNTLSLLNQLKSQEIIQSYQQTQKSQSCSSPSPSKRKLKIPLGQKILQLLNLNKRLVISTYLQTNSQKKIKLGQSPEKQRQRKLKDIQQTLSQIVRANLKQQQILQGNCWTKKLQNLLQIQEELKQSISFGPEQANALLREIKLSKLGKWGRQIGNSVIPQYL